LNGIGLRKDEIVLHIFSRMSGRRVSGPTLRELDRLRTPRMDEEEEEEEFEEEVEDEGQAQSDSSYSAGVKRKLVKVFQRGRDGMVWSYKKGNSAQKWAWAFGCTWSWRISTTAIAVLLPPLILHMQKVHESGASDMDIPDF
jgi:hypothetical protein